MCGIAGIYVKDPTVIKNHKGLEEFVDDMFRGIEHRGRRASGFVAVAEDGRVVIDKAPLTASEFIKEREPLPVGTHTVLIHTRLDTKGSPNDSRNNHPVIHKTCFTIHNGWVRNDDELFTEGNFERIAEVDSEIIAAMMYESDFDVEKMKVAFDKMEGAIACATIDPVRHPKKLVLARVEASPLEYVDTPKFIVWASEKKTIREAWGNHIGTPPAEKKISSLDRLTMLVVNDGVIERVKIPYTPKGYTGRYVGYGYNNYPTYGRKDGTTSGSTHSASDTPTSPTSAQEVLVTNDEIKQHTLALRAGLGGKSKLWTEKGKYGIAIGIGPWNGLCDVCETRVHHSDLRDSLKGRICVDCYETWMDLAVKRRNEVAKQAKPWAITSEYDEVNALFSLRQRHLLGNWAEDEAFVHQQALTELAKKTGMSEEAIDYLLFRSTSYHDTAIKNLPEWRTSMLAFYDEEYEAMWEFYNADAADGIIEILTTPDAAQSAAVFAASEQKALPPATVQTYKVLFSQHGINDGKCRTCRRKTKQVIERAETSELLAYCNQHFTKCGVNKCKNPANHTRHDGIRVCHDHARGMRECYADTFLKGAGYLVGTKE